MGGKMRYDRANGGSQCCQLPKLVNSDDLDLIHSSLNSDRDFVLEIVTECKKKDYTRFHLLEKGGGIEWVRAYIIVSKNTWDDWKKQSKKLQRQTSSV